MQHICITKRKTQLLHHGYIIIVKVTHGSYSKTNEMHSFLKVIFEIEFYMFRTGFLSIIRSLVLYTQDVPS